MEDSNGKLRSASVSVPKSKPVGKRVASVYDAVAGRIGLSGFLSREQMAHSNALPSAPEEVLLRRVGAPDQIPYDYYDADEKLQDPSVLPDSDLLKAIHTYSSDFYGSDINEGGTSNFRSFDETALLALGILLEEASKEVLGEAGDMVLTESSHTSNNAVETKLSRRQIIGKVSPRKMNLAQAMEESSEDELQNEASPRKKQK